MFPWFYTVNHIDHLLRSQNDPIWCCDQWKSNVLFWRMFLVYQCPTRRDNTNICLTRLYSLPDPPTLPRTVLKDLLEFATKKSHFIFDGQYYDQIDGVAMGSPLGPVLANIFMGHFEESWLTNNQFRPSIWFRYVDDTFSLFDSKDTASRFLDFLNNRHPNIKFTMELEVSSATTTHFQLLYTIKRLSLVFTPRKYKVNLIRTLTYRCLLICSKSTLLQSALSDLKNSLLQNGYPKGVINYNVNDLHHKHKNKHNLLSRFLRKM